MVDRLQVRFMTDKVGNEYDAIVSGTASFGLFVDLIGIFVSGMVEITALKDDYYHLDEKSHTLVGKRTGKRYQLGNLIRVKVSDVDVNRRRVYFTVVSTVTEGMEPAAAMEEVGEQVPEDADKRPKGRRRGQRR
jgi:ribonuclease R